MRTREWRIILLFLLTVSLIFLSEGRAQAQNVHYMYDALGRLAAVVDAGGDTAVYHYDAVGNVLSIDRYASSDVSIISFSPSSGPVGTTVTVRGTGFSATINQNTLTFNGTTATITSASTTQLVATVPSGATTGTIGVTSPGGSATSDGSFTVASPSAPTISSFTPSVGAAGTSISVSGTNFDTTAANNRVKLNATFAAPSSLTATSFNTAAPLVTASGPISVATPEGTATSATDFFIPPSPYTASDVDYTGRLTMGSGQTLTIATAAKIGLSTFTGTIGQKFSLVATSGTFGGAGGCNLAITVQKPDASTLLSGACMGGSGFFDATPLPAAGTYTVVLDAAGSTTGSISVAPHYVSDATSSITAGGSAVTVTTTTPGQNGLVTFSGTANHGVSLLATSATFGGIGGCNLPISIVKPDGTVLVTGSCLGSGGFIDGTLLPVTGTYTIKLDPISTIVGSATLTLYDSTDATGSITAGGSAVTATTTTPGQNVVLTFSGTASQRVSLLGASASFTNLTFGCEANVRIRKPDGSTLLSDTCMEFGGFIDVTTLPTTGTYTVVVDPASTATGSIALTLYDVPADANSSITVGGSAVTVTTTAPGQNGALTFSGTSGQQISLLGTSSSFPNLTWGCELTVRIKKPDGSTLVSDTCMEGGGFIDRTTLPTTGTYTITVDPGLYATGSITFALYDVSTDATWSITAGGSAVTATISTPGQNGALTFSGTSGQQISLLGTSSSFPNLTWGCELTIRIKKPDGSTLVSDTCMEGGGFVDRTTLPATGTYTITVDPGLYATGSITFALYDVSTDATWSITAGGSAVTATISTPGQNGALTFSGTSGQQISLLGTSPSFPNLTFGCEAVVRIKKPDASALVGDTCMEGSGFIDVTTLPTTGTYTIALDPGLFATGSLTFTLYDVPADASNTLTIGGGSVTLTTTVAGQNGLATFSGTASQQVTVHLTSNSMGNTTVKLLKPDGSTLTSATSGNTSFDLSTQTLPTTGTYTVTVDPPGTNTGSITVAVTSP